MATGLFTLKQVNQAISQGAWSGYIAPRWVEYLVVAGGGGGGRYYSGGGAGGGLLTGIVTVTAGTSYTVTVGSGGAAGTTVTGSSGVIGGSSVFGSITATGGGYGSGSNASLVVGGSGGSGGGGGGTSGSSGAGGSGISGQGNSGGNSTVTGGSGGGGAGTVGLNNPSSSIAGNGGAGIASAINGSVVTYAGGGGGSNGTSGSGGVGGGGNGATDSVAGTSGGGNTGGGGGGGSNPQAAGAGGSGIVVVRYPGNVQFYTGGAITYVNGYIVHIFYASGTLAPTTPAVVATDYQISRSLRFNPADTTYLSRTPATATNRRTWTWSAWVKVTALGLAQYGMFSCRGSGGAVPATTMGLYTDNSFIFSDNGSGGVLLTTQLFRDLSAWYHIVVAADTTQATSSDRIKIFVNGTQVTSFSSATYPAQNSEFAINSTLEHNIGKYANAGNYANAYMTEVNFIDGQALTPSSFGATNANTGVWGPKAYTGTYGTNGFYLNFSDNSNTTAATLGKDYSGNGNNWTPNNFSVTAGAGNDSLVDVPTNYGTDYGVGGAVRGNYATLNPLANGISPSNPLTNGNLDVGQALDATVFATIGMTSGKWYCELTLNSVTSGANVGIGKEKALNSWLGSSSTDYSYATNGSKYNSNSGSAYGASWTTGDTIGIAFDADVGTLVFYKNGTSQGTAFSSLTSGPYFFGWGGNSATGTFNFGQRAWAYTPPGGFKALVTQNLPTTTIGSSPTTLATQFFNPVIWTGDGNSPRNITGVGFQPDLVWIKQRTGTNWNILNDVVRGVPKNLYSNTTNVEDTTSYVTALNSDGFTLSSSGAVNLASSTYVAWNWKANGTGVSNTAGSITSTVSANTTSGFSVVTWTGTSFGYTVGHGLSVAPAMVIVKNRSSVSSWWVYHQSLSSGYGLNLETTGAQQASIWGSVTSTTFPIGSNVYSGGTTNYVAYCFAAIAGFSVFGSYVGNGSADGVFVYTGFRPAYILNKSTSAGNGWNIHDDARSPNNVASQTLFANTDGTEGGIEIDILSNGFKARDTSSNVNGNGVTYIFAAFAETPFKYSLAR